MPRSYSQAKVGESARQAVSRAQATTGGKAPSKPNASGATGDDYERIGSRAVELFSRDTIRDDGQDETELLARPDDAPSAEAVQARLAELKAAGKADNVRAQQGGIVATRKGVVVEWLVPADRTTKGTVAGSSARAGIRQREQAKREGLAYGERVDRRLRAIAGSWIGKAGTHEDVQAAMRAAYVKDRKARGWAVPTFRDAGENDDDDGEDF